MSAHVEQMAARVDARLAAHLTRRQSAVGELSYEVAPADLVAAVTTLRDEPDLRFEMLIDIAGVDFMEYGRTEWRTASAAWVQVNARDCDRDAGVVLQSHLSPTGEA